MTDNHSSPGNHPSQHLNAAANVEDPVLISEPAVFDTESWGEKEREAKEGRQKSQRRGNVKKIFMDALGTLRGN